MSTETTSKSGSFFGAHPSSSSKAPIIGIPLKTGSAKDGCENAPFYLRACSKRYTWSASAPANGVISDSLIYPFNCKDLGDIPGLDDNHSSSVQQIENFIDAVPYGEVPIAVSYTHLTLPTTPYV